MCRSYSKLPKFFVKRTKMEEEIPHRAPGEPPPLVISFLSEFCGTAVLMWVGCMGCLELFGIGPVIPAFAFGLAVTMAIQSFAHISPVHINPAVSTGVLVLGKIRPVTYLVYISAQFLGALVGFALLQVVMPWHDQKLCVLHLGAYMDPVKGFFIEFGATFVLMLVVSSLFDPKNAPFEDSLSLKLGMVIAGLVFSVAPFTGAGLNPARALAPALLYNHWSNSWLYLLAPFCGMIASALISRFVFNAYEKYSLYNFLRRYCKWCAI